MYNSISKTERRERKKHMKLDITRAWKDELYRLSLSEEELLTLPESPVGGLELSDDILDTVYGGWRHHHHEHHHHHHEDDDSHSDSESEHSHSDD
jgi:mersacidin/lichenicidin family type 2 lantibiotic